VLAPLIPLSLDRVDQPFADAMVPIIESQPASQSVSQSVSHAFSWSFGQSDAAHKLQNSGQRAGTATTGKTVA
jgi:hypothetical protein